MLANIKIRFLDRDSKITGFYAILRSKVGGELKCLTNQTYSVQPEHLAILKKHKCKYVKLG